MKNLTAEQKDSLVNLIDRHIIRLSADARSLNALNKNSPRANIYKKDLAIFREIKKKIV